MRRTRIIALTAGVLGLAATVSLAAAADRGAVLAALPRLVELAEAVIERGDVPGLAIAVVHEDEVVLLDGFGVKRIGVPDQVGPDTVFPLASVSKSVAASVVASMVGEGIVGWDTPIKALDPVFRFYDPCVENSVTIRDLLSHRSGLAPGAGNDLELLGYGSEDILGRLHLLEAGGRFRADFLYSNYGVTLGAKAAAAAAGEEWESLAETRLYEPLGMAHTSSRFADFLAEPDRVAYHTSIDGEWHPAPDHNADAASPAGGVSSTARDLAQWVRMLLARGTLDGKQVIKANAISEMWLPAISSGISPATGQPSFYGIGWSIDNDAFGKHINHSGVFTSGVRALVDLIPEEDIGIVILANAYPSGVPEGLSASFYELVFDGQTDGAKIALFNEALAQGYGQFLAALSGPLTVSPQSTIGALPAASYVGSYSNPYVGAVRIEERDAGLVLVAGPTGETVFRLNHFDRDVFYIAPAVDTPNLLLPVVFTLGSDRQARDVSIALIGSGALDRLIRVRPPDK